MTIDMNMNNRLNWGRAVLLSLRLLFYAQHLYQAAFSSFIFGFQASGFFLLIVRPHHFLRRLIALSYVCFMSC